ncbi:MAG: Hpt domain-containing protein [Hyphomonas sp.]
MTEDAPAPLALLDRDHLTAMTGGDTSLAVEVIDIFRHQAEIWSRLLDPRADASQWADAAHTLKGASLGIGAVRLASVCGRAERLGRAETPPSVTAAAVMLGDVKDTLGDTLEAVARLAHELASSGATRAS